MLPPGGRSEGRLILLSFELVSHAQVRVKKPWEWEQDGQPEEAEVDPLDFYWQQRRNRRSTHLFDRKAKCADRPSQGWGEGGVWRGGRAYGTSVPKAHTNRKELSAAVQVQASSKAPWSMLDRAQLNGLVGCQFNARPGVGRACPIWIVFSSAALAGEFVSIETTPMVVTTA